jgi:hypothetical protein
MWTIALSFAKRYLLPILVGVVATALIASHWWTYNQGKQGEKLRQEAKRLTLEQEARKVQETLADELEQARKARKPVYRDRVRYVERAPDPTGCRDAPVPDGVLQRLPGGARLGPPIDSPGR